MCQNKEGERASKRERERARDDPVRAPRRDESREWGRARAAEVAAGARDAGREREGVGARSRVAGGAGEAAGGEFVYRLGERREQSVRGATFGVLHLVAAVRDALAIG